MWHAEQHSSPSCYVPLYTSALLSFLLYNPVHLVLPSHNRPVLLRRRRPGLLGQTAVPLHTRERPVRALRRVVAALQLVITVARRLVLIVIAAGATPDVTVTRVRAVLGRVVRRGRRVTALAQAAVGPRMLLLLLGLLLLRLLGPSLLSDGRCHRAHVLDVADALHPTVTLRATRDGWRPRW